MTADEAYEAQSKWLPLYHAYQTECKSRGEPCKNVNEWFKSRSASNPKENT